MKVSEYFVEWPFGIKDHSVMSALVQSTTEIRCPHLAIVLSPGLFY